ncbi:phosphonate ABC transporter substrate-binding protein [Bradyrhizobium sp. WSM2254]|uniref:phosphonate ABC transporter substrate-binding protein n=1 Tax=Bradyrhizobium sp. WSM2254 TaxID=1188263 RepID=UPI00040654CF|nr:phosphonate ABC transporter substrate-binding protein [Bradyrhizobium sp. WSM2254]
MTDPIARRTLLALAAASSLVAVTSPALADWRDRYKELNFGISSSENQRDAVVRYEPFAAYLSNKLGVPVRILWGTDYAAVIEALRSGKIQFAFIGAANYALGHKVMGSMIVPVGIDQSQDGSTGYYSVIVVRKDSPYHSLEDLKGKVLAWVDPNSTSGYAVPNYFMNKQGINPATFFSKTPFSGSHELGVIGLINGTFDAAADYWMSDNSSNVVQMEKKGMISKDKTRVIWRSSEIPNGPYAMRADLPDDLKQAFGRALFSAAQDDPKAYEGLGYNQKQIVPVTPDRYDDIIAITEANHRARRGQ